MTSLNNINNISHDHMTMFRKLANPSFVDMTQPPQTIKYVQSNSRAPSDRGHSRDRDRDRDRDYSRRNDDAREKSLRKSHSHHHRPEVSNMPLPDLPIPEQYQRSEDNMYKQSQIERARELQNKYGYMFAKFPDMNDPIEYIDADIQRAERRISMNNTVTNIKNNIPLAIQVLEQLNESYIKVLPLHGLTDQIHTSLTQNANQWDHLLERLYMKFSHKGGSTSITMELFQLVLLPIIMNMLQQFLIKMGSSAPQPMRPASSNVPLSHKDPHIMKQTNVPIHDDMKNHPNIHDYPIEIPVSNMVNIPIDINNRTYSESGVFQSEMHPGIPQNTVINGMHSNGVHSNGVPQNAAQQNTVPNKVHLNATPQYRESSTPPIHIPQRPAQNTPLPIRISTIHNMIPEQEDENDVRMQQIHDLQQQMQQQMYVFALSNDKNPYSSPPANIEEILEQSSEHSEISSASAENE